jgi:hypothetical protein
MSNEFKESEHYKMVQEFSQKVFKTICDRLCCRGNHKGYDGFRCFFCGKSTASQYDNFCNECRTEIPAIIAEGYYKIANKRRGLLSEEKSDEVAKDIYDLIYLKENPPSGKEFGAYLECRGIAKALIDKYGFNENNNY